MASKENADVKFICRDFPTVSSSPTTTKCRVSKKLQNFLKTLHSVSANETTFEKEKIYSIMYDYVYRNCCQVVIKGKTSFVNNDKLKEIFQSEIFTAEDLPDLLTDHIYQISYAAPVPPSYYVPTIYSKWTNVADYVITNPNTTYSTLTTVNQRGSLSTPRCLNCGKDEMEQIFSKPYGYCYQCQECLEVLVIPYEVIKYTTPLGTLYALNAWKETKTPNNTPDSSSENEESLCLPKQKGKK
jgi:hypothetical protein